MILVTGAAGKTGRTLIQALSAKGEDVRALVHRSEQIQIIEELGAQDVVVGDMSNRGTMDRVARGTRAVYHICPNVSPDEVIIGETVIAACRSAGVECFVFHSVLHPQTEAMPHHWKKLRVEEMLFESRLPYTILQPATYMQNLLAYWCKIHEEGIFQLPYSVETRLSMVDLNDVAQAAAIVLTEPGHVGATYGLVGTQAMTQSEVAEILSQQLGRSVRAESISLDVWEQGARASGLGDYQIDTLLKMFRYYERFGFLGSPRVLNWLLKRPPTSLAEFIERTAQERLN